ncbi:hypothetical protein OSB04_016223 [Centaurea solstitialis]|uniref:Alcohol dehydrogenase-like N-terminal domain-containing protein n=1 Tax=Centaurea solstitialis TaxID=347529 RepID=A0AA38T0K9_9ASTR|nr:hypothetical protein OSB04_016223 [Centaurea solstitialis]
MYSPLLFIHPLIAGKHPQPPFHRRKTPTATFPSPENTMVKAITLHQHGGPQVLKYEDVEVGDPKEGEIRIKHKAIGINFCDVYMRKDLYQVSPPLPYTPGLEGAGVVTAVGAGVTACKVGDLVAYGTMDVVGSYSEERILRANLAVPVPSSIDPVIAASIIFKGFTAQLLVRDSTP